MADLQSLQTLVQQAIGNSDYTAALITGHLNQAVRLVAARVRLPELSASYPIAHAQKYATNATLVDGSAVKITSIAHGFSTGDLVMMTGIKGTTELNSTVYAITKVDADTFTLDGTVVYDAEPDYTAWAGGTITAITLVVGDPVKITSVAAHGLATGDEVYFYDGIGGTEELDGRVYTITVVDSTNFTLDDTEYTAAANYTAFAAGATDFFYSAGVIYRPCCNLPANFDYQREWNVLRVYSRGQSLSFEYRGSLGGRRGGLGSGVGMLLDSWEEFTRLYPIMNQTGSIAYIVARGTKLWFQPMPQSDTLFVYYQRVPTAMSAATDTPDGLPEFLHEGLVQYAAREIFEEQGQLQLATYREAKWQTYLKEVDMFVGGPDVALHYIQEAGGWYAVD